MIDAPTFEDACGESTPVSFALTFRCGGGGAKLRRMTLDVYHFHCAYAATVKRFYMNMLFVLIFCGRRCDYTEVSKRDGPRTRGRHVPGRPMIAMQTDDRDGRWSKSV